MFSVWLKKENAHDDGIWTCAWGRCLLDQNKKNKEHDDEEKSRDSAKSDEENPIDYLVTGSVDDLVKVWELEDNRIVLKHKLEGHSLGVVSVAISNSGEICASTSMDSSMRIWDLQTGEKIGTVVDVGPVDIWTLDFSPDDKYIISGSHSGKITLYNVKTQKAEQTLDTRGKFILSIAYSPDGKFIASGAIDGIINIFDVAANKLSHTLEGHAMSIRALCFSPDSQLLLTASDDGHMKLYDVQNTDVIATLSGHASWVLSVSFSPDGKYFVSGSSDKTVKVWEVESKTCIQTFEEHKDQVWGVKFSPDSTKILSVSDDKYMIIYNKSC